MEQRSHGIFDVFVQRLQNVRAKPDWHHEGRCQNAQKNWHECFNLKGPHANFAFELLELGRGYGFESKRVPFSWWHVWLLQADPCLPLCSMHGGWIHVDHRKVWRWAATTFAEDESRLLSYKNTPDSTCRKWQSTCCWTWRWWIRGSNCRPSSSEWKWWWVTGKKKTTVNDSYPTWQNFLTMNIGGLFIMTDQNLMRVQGSTEVCQTRIWEQSWETPMTSWMPGSEDFKVSWNEPLWRMIRWRRTQSKHRLTRPRTCRTVFESWSYLLGMVCFAYEFGLLWVLNESETHESRWPLCFVAFPWMLPTAKICSCNWMP